MPDVSELLSNVTALLESNIKAEVEDGQQVFRNIQREIQRSVDEHIPSVQEQIAHTGNVFLTLIIFMTSDRSEDGDSW